MAGQNHHFALYAPEKLPYAVDRYVKETNGLYGVIESPARPSVFGRRLLDSGHGGVSLDCTLSTPGSEVGRFSETEDVVRCYSLSTCGYQRTRSRPPAQCTDHE